jgi:hypothetical protein
MNKFIVERTKFTIDTKTYNQAGKVIRYPRTLGFHFINTGSDVVYLNNLPLYPSGVFDTMINNCQDVSDYNIRWVQPATNPELTVITFNEA